MRDLGLVFQAIRIVAAHKIVADWKPRARQGQHIPKPPRNLWMAAATVASVAHNISVPDICADRRFKRVVTARGHAWAILRALGYSLPGIALLTGHDHTTVLHGLRRFALLDCRNALSFERRKLMVSGRGLPTADELRLCQSNLEFTRARSARFDRMQS